MVKNWQDCIHKVNIDNINFNRIKKRKMESALLVHVIWWTAVMQLLTYMQIMVKFPPDCETTVDLVWNWDVCCLKSVVSIGMGGKKVEI